MSKELEELIHSGRKRLGAASPASRARVTAKVASSTGAMLAVTGTAAGASAAAGATVATSFVAPFAVKLAVTGVLAISAVGTGYFVTSRLTPEVAGESRVIEAQPSTLQARTPEPVEPSLVTLEEARAIEEEVPTVAVAEVPTSTARRAALRRELMIEGVEPVVAPREEVAPPSLREALWALRAASDALARHDASQAISILELSEIPASLVEQREGILTIARCRLSPSRRSELRAAFETAYPRSPMGSRVRSECPAELTDRTVVDSITE